MSFMDSEKAYGCAGVWCTRVIAMSHSGPSIKYEVCPYSCTLHGKDLKGHLGERRVSGFGTSEWFCWIRRTVTTSEHRKW